MNRRMWILLAAGGSAALLLAAFGFQFLGGLAPCKLCLWQRWPHAAAILLGAIGIFYSTRLVPALGAIAAALTGGFGVYHAGVEKKWWAGPSTCTSGDVTGLSTDDLMNQIMNAPLVRCDEIPWEFLGLSMASWNAIASFGFMVFWLIAIFAPSPSRDRKVEEKT